METLKAALEEQITKSGKKYSEEKKLAYQRGIAAVDESGILSSALKVGDKAPDFSLKNRFGNVVSLKAYLSNGPVILTWYRGGWCPYCSIALRFLQQVLDEFKALGTNLVALTPELPDKSLNTVESNMIDFEVLTDSNADIARQYGLTFRLIPEVAEIYQDLFDLANYNGNNNAELPLAATYIVDQQSVIRYAFLDADYRRRAEPAEIIQVLKSL